MLLGRVSEFVIGRVGKFVRSVDIENPQGFPEQHVASTRRTYYFGFIQVDSARYLETHPNHPLNQMFFAAQGERSIRLRLPGRYRRTVGIFNNI